MHMLPCADVGAAGGRPLPCQDPLPALLPSAEIGPKKQPGAQEIAGFK